jgi:nucleoside-diphosphate-sugar epimerase
MTASPDHVVLGGNGVVGRETLGALARAGLPAVSVGRRTSAAGGVRSRIADLLDPTAVARALEGAQTAYLVAGLPYSARVWARDWPVIVRSVTEAALAAGTHLVYLDNVYAYGRVDAPMTEQTPIHPTSRKGEVRAAALVALAAAAARGLPVTIARSADFYGPGAGTSVFTLFALDPIARGRAGTWLIDSDQPHSLTYTPDIGEALVVLGTESAARGRTWHLPTAPALTGREYIEIAGGPGARVKTMGRGTLRIGGLFNPAARETLEMAYQYEVPYFFDSTAFATEFGRTATPTTEGIAATLAASRAAIGETARD